MPVEDTQGFAVIEVMVAAVVLLITALATLALVDAAHSESGQQRMRSDAVALGHSDLERLHHLSAADLTGTYDQTRTVSQDGHTFTVRSQATATGDGATDVACTTDPSQAQYLQLTSTVTWSGMRPTAPVVLVGLLAPPVQLLSPTNGTITMRLHDAAAEGVQGQDITLTGNGTHTGTTNELGCATYALLPGGDYTAAYAKDGWVDPTGRKDVSSIVHVNAGLITVIDQLYDRAATVDVSFDTDAGDGRGSVPVAYRSAAFGASGLTVPRTFPATGGGTATGPATASTIEATKLYPFTSGYGVWAGDCKGTDPSQYDPNYFTENAALATPSPGGSTAVRVRVPTVRVTDFSDTQGDPVSGGHLVVTPDTGQQAGNSGSSGTSPMAGCDATPIVGAIDGGAGSVVVPFGSYTLCVDDGSSRRTQSLTVKSRDATILDGPSMTDAGTCPTS